MIFQDIMTCRIQMDRIPLHILKYISEFDNEVGVTFMKCAKYFHNRNSSVSFLEYCITRSHTGVLLSCLPKHDFSREEDVFSMFDFAVAWDNTPVVEWMCIHLKPILKRNTMLMSTFDFAVSECSPSMFHRLIYHFDIDLEWNGCMFLEDAVSRNNITAVKNILDSPFMEDPYGSNNNSLIRAIELGHYRILRYMVCHPKIDVSEPDNEPFKTALWFRDTIAIGILINDDKVFMSLPSSLSDEEKYILSSLTFDYY